VAVTATRQVAAQRSDYRAVMTTTEPPLITRPRLRQFALYDNHEAGLAARWLTTEIERNTRSTREVSRELWKFDIAHRNGPLREMSLQDAGEAEVIVLAASDVAQPDPAFLDWLVDLTPWKANRAECGVLLALLVEADDEPWNPPSRLRSALMDFSQRADLEFLWRPMRLFQEDDLDWVKPSLARWAGR
jgi:hypothetical protein